MREADLYVSATAFNDLMVFTQAVTNEPTPAAIDNGSMVGLIIHRWWTVGLCTNS